MRFKLGRGEGEEEGGKGEKRGMECHHTSLGSNTLQQTCRLCSFSLSLSVSLHLSSSLLDSSKGRLVIPHVSTIMMMLTERKKKGARSLNIMFCVASAFSSVGRSSNVVLGAVLLYFPRLPPAPAPAPALVAGGSAKALFLRFPPSKPLTLGKSRPNASGFLTW